MRALIFVIFMLASGIASADTAKYCDQIERFRIWANGSDTYGVWVEYGSHPETCPGGFYLPHESANKHYVMSFLLAEKAQGNTVCMQVVTTSVISGRCKVNYVYNP